MVQYTIKSAHLANPKKDQNLFNISTSAANKINNILHHTNTIKCNIVAFLRLSKSTQNKKNTTAETIIMNCKRLKCIYVLWS